ncbi:MAG: 50S ribosomal protein L9 [Bacteroidota bacterium]|nr:50S ribosomal protein L9 [Bacteroidota bacterium]
MNIILKKDMTNLGHKDDLVTVKDGYALNFLIPKGIAIAATKSAVKMHEENQRQRAHKIEKIRNEAQEIANKISGIKVRIAAKASSAGKIFGSVNNIMLAEALEKEGVTIERKNIEVGDNVKEVGNFTAKVKLYKDIIAELEYEVYAEE